MKVLIIGTAGRYGAQLSLFYLCKELQDKGVTVQVVLPKKGDTDKLYSNEGIKCYIIRNGLAWGAKTFNLKECAKKKLKLLVNMIAEYKLSKIIEKENFDIVHLNSIGVSVGVKSAIKYNKKMVWHIREFVDEDLNRKLYDENLTYALVKNADAVIAISKAVMDKYTPLLCGADMRVIYNGIDSNPYVGVQRKILANDIVRIVVPGRICYEKGQFILVEAMNLLVKHRRCVYVDFCGDGNGDDSEYLRIRNMVEKANISDLISFSGYCKNMKYKYQEADICVVPSKMEAFGRVTVEAMMAGCLVIGTNSGGTKELLADGKGLLFEFENSVELAEKIEWTMENRDLARHIAETGRRTSIHDYSAEKNAENIYNLYKELS